MRFAGELVVCTQARQVPAQRSERRERAGPERAHLSRQHQLPQAALHLRSQHRV